jgi:MinD superfamily P-loop ATPase
VCVFEAISNYKEKNYAIDPISCEGCGVCYFFCPHKAIKFEEEICGEWFISATKFGLMVHAKLGIASENSGKLVSLVRNKAKEIAETRDLDLVLNDGPPGIGCPVIASVTGADMVLVVTEPTLSGKHDLERIAKLTAHFKIPTYVCINKYDINRKIALEIEDLANKLKIKSIGRIPYDSQVTKAQIEKKSIVEYKYNNTSKEITKIWQFLLSQIHSTENKK